MVRRVVKAFGHAALRVDAIAELSRDHERRDARDVGAPREHEQIEHQHRVLLEIGRDAVRLVGHVDRRERRVRRERDPALDLAHVGEVVVESCAVGVRASRASTRRRRPSTESSRLDSCRCRAARSAGVLPSPSRRSNTTRGFVSIGSGVCGVRYEIDAPDSSASSSDGSGVSWPICRAATWSTDVGVGPLPCGAHVSQHCDERP